MPGLWGSGWNLCFSAHCRRRERIISPNPATKIPALVINVNAEYPIHSVPRSELHPNWAFLEEVGAIGKLRNFQNCKLTKFHVPPPIQSQDATMAEISPALLLKREKLFWGWTSRYIAYRILWLFRNIKQPCVVGGIPRSVKLSDMYWMYTVRHPVIG